MIESFRSFFYSVADKITFFKSNVELKNETVAGVFFNKASFDIIFNGSI